ncbi:MAG: DEAD/DEAH box helicase [Candidatus Margulisbacteria bacterium]|nr:DEAD/DEAH box helicase [Candidatus Margulisiibacteriota bacterium]
MADDMGLGKTIQAIAFTSVIKDENPTLIIGPSNVIYNWEQEINTFTPSKSVVMYTGSNRSRKLNPLEKPAFIITSFGVIKNDIDLLKTIPFKAIIVDEAQYIKNPNTLISKSIKQLTSPFKLAMTGTPVENHFQDLWNLFDFVMPDFLGSKADFDRSMKEGQKDWIKTKIKPFIMRREKQEVLQSLPEKTEVMLHCTMSETQETLYQTVLNAAKKGIKNSHGKTERLNILTALLKLRQVCLHPGLIQEFKGQALTSAKFELAKEKLLELMAENHKCVVFTQFTGMLDILEEWTEDLGVSVYRIDGSVPAKMRQERVGQFQQSSGAGIFLISLKAGGVGINLTAADYVFHLDPWWNPAVEAQATDRVHRMGQQNKVMVYKFITQGTIEEKILALQDAKKTLLGEIIDIDSIENQKVNIDDLKSLLF